MKGKAFNEALFNAAIQGQMTQFCEEMKPQPIDCSEFHKYASEDCEWRNEPMTFIQDKDNSFFCKFCGNGVNFAASKIGRKGKGHYMPRFQVGEKVFLKEPYSADYDMDAVRYKYDYDTDDDCIFDKSICMKEEYARYFIEITGVKAERLQDISDEDLLESGIFIDYIESHYYQYYDHRKRFWCEKCIDKGIEQLEKELRANPSLLQIGDSNEVDEDDKEHEEYLEEWFKEEFGGYSMDDFFDQAITCDMCEKDLSVIKNISGNKKYYDITEAYAELIDEIHGKGTWERNPYIFQYEFKLLK